MAYLDFMSVTTSSIRVRLAGLDETSQSNMGTSRLPRHNSYQVSCLGDVRSLSKGSGGNSGSAAYSGLSAGTEYHFVATVSFTNGSGVTSDIYIEDYCSTEENPRPSNWNWTSAELNAFNNQGEISTLTYSRWNSFCNKVSEFRAYRGLDSVPGYAYMTSSDKILTADRFNIVRQYIGSMYSTGISVKSPGDVVYGSYFVTLANALNSIS